MRTQLIHINAENENYCGLVSELHRGSTNKEDRARMKEFLKKALTQELTELQKICITEYYIKGKREKDIAVQLGLHKSTVSRHITAGMKKLQNTANYYFSAREHK